MEKQFEKQSIPFERFDAINGKKINYNNLMNKKIIKDRRFLITPNKKRLGILGTYLSHIHLWIELFQKNDDYFIILEDDVFLVDNFMENAKKIILSAPKNWDILFLSYADGLKGHKLSKVWLQPISGHYPHTNHGLFTYVINKKSIPKLLKLLLPIAYQTPHIDHKIRSYYNKGINAAYYIPKLSLHNDKFTSDRENI